MLRISHLKAREILDSRGNPTVEAEMFLEGGKNVVRACVPSGASTGSKEALELRDNEPERYCGKGVRNAIDNVHNIIAPKLKGRTFASQEELDHYLIDLDGDENKRALGANAILSISIAFSKAIADHRDIPLFRSIQQDYRQQEALSKHVIQPMFNVINGGAHADNQLALQEFMIVIDKSYKVAEQVRIAAEIFHNIKKILLKRGEGSNVGDEGGFAPNIKDAPEAIEIILQAIINAGYTPGVDVFLALDAAANEFYRDGMYFPVRNQSVDREGLLLYYTELVRNYPIISIEDPYAEEDYKGWKSITAAIGLNVNIVGDDLFVTNTQLLNQGIEQQWANSILIKLNQIGTVTETFDAIRTAQANNINTIISHRSGETEDTYISHLAVGVCSGYLKAGSLSRSERVCKYNELMRIEDSM